MLFLGKEEKQLSKKDISVYLRFFYVSGKRSGFGYATLAYNAKWKMLRKCRNDGAFSATF